MAKRRLTCCVCGDDAGRHEQHWNRDTGFGICRKCVDWLKNDKKVSDEEMLSNYGKEGVNYAGPTPAPKKQWTVESVKEELPDVKVKHEENVFVGSVRGRKNNFATVFYGDNMTATFAWETITHALNDDSTLLD